jgi:hypothetical protein
MRLDHERRHRQGRVASVGRPAVHPEVMWKPWRQHVKASLARRPAVVTNNTSIQLFEAPAWCEAIAALGLALRPFPEARAAVIEVLRRLGASNDGLLIEARPRPSEAA